MAEPGSEELDPATCTQGLCVLVLVLTVSTVTGNLGVVLSGLRILSEPPGMPSGGTLWLSLPSPGQSSFPASELGPAREAPQDSQGARGAEILDEQVN